MSTINSKVEKSFIFVVPGSLQYIRVNSLDTTREGDGLRVCTWAREAFKVWAQNKKEAEGIALRMLGKDAEGCQAVELKFYKKMENGLTVWGMTQEELEQSIDLHKQKFN